jgi:hypothetical protein
LSNLKTIEIKATPLNVIPTIRKKLATGYSIDLKITPRAVRTEPIIKRTKI